MKSLAKLVLVLFLLSSVLAAVSPKEDGKYLEKQITYTLNADGSWVKDVRHSLRYDTYYATRRLAGETFVTYNPQYQELKVISSVTTMKDGKKVSLPANALNEVLPHGALGQPDYSHLKEMVIVHTGLEIGAVVDLHYQITTKPGFKPYFSGKEFIKDVVSTGKISIVIDVPASQPLYYSLTGYSVTPEIKDTGDRKIFSFAFDNLCPALVEPLDSDHDHPYLVFSTVNQWPDVFSSDLEKLAISDCFKKQIDNLKLKYKDTLQQYASLQKMVAVDMESSHLTPDLTGANIRELKDVFSSNYGTALEKALLLERGLAYLGAETELLAIAYDSGFGQNVASIEQVERYLVRVGKGDSALYLDPSHKQTNLLPFSLSGRQAFNVKQKNIDALPVYCACKNSIEISGQLNSSLLVALKGRFVPYVAALTGDSADLSKKISDLLDWDDLTVEKILMLTPAELRVQVKVPGCPAKAVAVGLHRVDKLHNPALEDGMAVLAARFTNLHIDSPFKVHYDLTFKLEKDSRVDYLAPAKKIENDLGYYKQEIVDLNNGSIGIKIETAVKKSVITPTEYSSLRQIVGAGLVSEPLVIFKK